MTTVRTLSINAGLDASTVTPGSTAPVVSFTTPAMLLPFWANEPDAVTRSTASATSVSQTVRDTAYFLGRTASDAISRIRKL